MARGSTRSHSVENCFGRRCGSVVRAWKIEEKFIFKNFDIPVIRTSPPPPPNYWDICHIPGRAFLFPVDRNLCTVWERIVSQLYSPRHHLQDCDSDIMLPRWIQTIPRSQIIAILVYVPSFFSYEVWTYFRIGSHKIFSSHLVVTQNIKLTAFYTPSHHSRWTFRIDHLSAVVSPHRVACHQMRTDSTTKVAADTIVRILIKTIWC